MTKFRDWLEKKESEVKLDEAKEIEISVLATVVNKYAKSIDKAVKDEKLMEIDSHLHSLKNSIEAWIPVIQEKIKAK
jgi:hypothetical protein